MGATGTQKHQIPPIDFDAWAASAASRAKVGSTLAAGEEGCGRSETFARHANELGRHERNQEQNPEIAKKRDPHQASTSERSN
jgi:hypothetical protein